jgi:hypothetical protein
MYHLRGLGYSGPGPCPPPIPTLKAVVAPPGTPGPGQCSIYDGACVAQNAALMDAYNVAMGICNGVFPVGTTVNSGIVSGIPAATPPPPAVTPKPPTAPATPAAVPNGGTFSFTTSRGSSAMQVGDTWLVSITGASPNTPVTVSGSMPSGGFTSTNEGSTDGSGNFSKSGTVGTGEIGNWSETWSVGPATSGSISFSVSAVPVVPPAGASPSPAGGSPLPAGAPAPGASVVPPSSGFDLSSIPVWGWALAAGVAVFAFSGGGRGR